jgi:hypothetical protein
VNLNRFNDGNAQQLCSRERERDELGGRGRQKELKAGDMIQLAQASRNAQKTEAKAREIS